MLPLLVLLLVCGVDGWSVGVIVFVVCCYVLLLVHVAVEGRRCCVLMCCLWLVLLSL